MENEPMTNTPEAQARIEYVKAAAAAVRGSAGGKFLEIAAKDPITEISDVIYLADYIERGAASYWLSNTEETTGRAEDAEVAE